MTDKLLHLAFIMGKMGLLSFGGNVTVLAQLELEMVSHGWITHAQFTEAYAMGLLTPGSGSLFVVPMGYRAAGLAGAAVSLIAYFAPTILSSLLVARIWKHFRSSPWCVSLRDGMVPVALGLILASIYSMGQAVITNVTVFFLIVPMTVLLIYKKLSTLSVLGIGMLAGILFLSP